MTRAFHLIGPIKKNAAKRHQFVIREAPNVCALKTRTPRKKHRLKLRAPSAIYSFRIETVVDNNDAKYDDQGITNQIKVQRNANY